jgi:hypothetical protein
LNRVSATVLLGFIAVVATSCGTRAAAPGTSDSPAPTESATASTPEASPSSSLSAVASPGVIADCPARISNVSGAYSFSCPAGWKYVNCEQSRFVDLYTWLINPQGCSPEPYTLRMMVWSRQGDQPFGINSYLGQPQSSQPVTVSGVSGERRTYLVTADNPIPPPKGTVQVEYRFLTGGRSYFALYDRWPGDTDLTAGFDQMVTTSLSFSASG